MKNIDNWIVRFDNQVIAITHFWAIPASRFAIFIVYFWFGLLKIVSTKGAANPMVLELLERTMPNVDPVSFLVAFGVLEMLIGLIFIIPHLERLGVFFLALHLFTTILPLFIMPDWTWQSFMVPTLEGQYIIKNLLTIALVIGILGHLRAYRAGV